MRSRSFLCSIWRLLSRVASLLLLLFWVGLDFLNFDTRKIDFKDNVDPFFCFHFFFWLKFSLKHLLKFRNYYIILTSFLVFFWIKIVIKSYRNKFFIFIISFYQRRKIELTIWNRKIKFEKENILSCVWVK